MIQTVAHRTIDLVRTLLFAVYFLTLRTLIVMKRGVAKHNNQSPQRQIKRPQIILYSFVIFTFYILPIQSFSQANIDHKPDAFTTLENEFEVSKLSEIQLDAFEARAIQKLRDLIDYSRLIHETSYPLELREQAIRLIRGMFSDSSNTIFFSVKNVSKSMSINEYFALPINAGSMKLFPTIENISIFEPFRKKTGGQYMGELNFQIANDDDRTKPFSSVEIILSRQKKQFGDKTSLVWEVKLGDISF